MYDSKNSSYYKKKTDQVRIIPLKEQFRQVMIERLNEENKVKSKQREILQIKRKTTDDVLMESKYKNLKKAQQDNREYLRKTKNMLNENRKFQANNLNMQKEKNQYLKSALQEARMRRTAEFKNKIHKEHLKSCKQREHNREVIKYNKIKALEMNIEKVDAIRQLRSSSCDKREIDRYLKKKNRALYMQELIRKEEAKRDAAIRIERELERQKADLERRREHGYEEENEDQ